MWNNNNNFYFLYYHPNGEKIILFQQKEYNLSTFNSSSIQQNSTLIVIDNLLFHKGKMIYLTYNFMKVIFLPYLLQQYLVLLNRVKKNNILLIINKDDGNLLIRTNEQQYLLHYNVAQEQLQLLDDMELPLEILGRRVIYTTPLYIIELLRSGYKYTIWLNILLILINIFIYLNRKWCH